MKQHLLVATLTFVLGISTLAPALGQVVLSEESFGEFSGNPISPTFVNLTPGDNSVSGQVGPALPDGTFMVDFEDHFAISIGAEETLEAIIVESFNPDIGNSGNLTTLFQFDPGAVFGAGDLISSILLSTDFSIGTDLLPAPVGPGDYTVRLGEAQGPATYSFRFELSTTATAVPEPSSAILLLVGLGIAARRRR